MLTSSPSKNCNVTCGGNFGRAEKGVAVNGGDNEDVFRRLTDVVMELVDVASWCLRSVG